MTLAAFAKSSIESNVPKVMSLMWVLYPEETPWVNEPRSPENNSSIQFMNLLFIQLHWPDMVLLFHLCSFFPLHSSTIPLVLSYPRPQPYGRVGSVNLVCVDINVDVPMCVFELHRSLALCLSVSLHTYTRAKTPHATTQATTNTTAIDVHPPDPISPCLLVKATCKWTRYSPYW